MFDEYFGLPAHILVVHAPVVLIPLAVLVALGYAVVPPLRRHLWWALGLLAAAGAGSAWLAVETGKAFKRTFGPSPAIDQHQQLGETLRIYVTVFAVVALALIVVDLVSRRRLMAGGSDAPAPRPAGRSVLLVVSVVFSLALIALAAVSAWYVIRTGDTGARMVWGQG